MSLLATPFAQSKSIASMDRDTTTQIRQGEVDPAISAKGRTKQGEQCLILVDGQKLPITQRPTFGGKHKTKNPNLG